MPQEIIGICIPEVTIQLDESRSVSAIARFQGSSTIGYRQAEATGQRLALRIGQHGVRHLRGILGLQGELHQRGRVAESQFSARFGGLRPCGVRAGGKATGLCRLSDGKGETNGEASPLKSAAAAVSPSCRSMVKGWNDWPS